MVKMHYRVSASVAPIGELRRLPFGNEVFAETRIDEDDVAGLKRKFDSKARNDKLSAGEGSETGNRC
jgi:hypothetical protein